MGIISDELYDSLRRSCGRDYQKLDLNNVECSRNLEAFNQSCSGLFKNQILEPKCASNEFSGERRALNERLRKLYNPKSSVSAFKCRDPLWSSILHLQTLIAYDFLSTCPIRLYCKWMIHLQKLEKKELDLLEDMFILVNHFSSSVFILVLGSLVETPLN